MNYFIKSLLFNLSIILLLETSPFILFDVVSSSPFFINILVGVEPSKLIKLENSSSSYLSTSM